MSDSAYEKQPGTSTGETSTPDAMLQFQLLSAYERGYSEGWNARHFLTTAPIETRLQTLKESADLLRGALQIIDQEPAAGQIHADFRRLMGEAVHRIRMALK